MHNLCSPQYTKGLPDSSVEITPLPHHIFSTSDEKQTPLKPYLSHPFLPWIKLHPCHLGILQHCDTEASCRHPLEETGCLKTRVLWDICTTHNPQLHHHCAPTQSSPQASPCSGGPTFPCLDVRPHKFCLHLTNI